MQMASETLITGGGGFLRKAAAASTIAFAVIRLFSRTFQGHVSNREKELKQRRPPIITSPIIHAEAYSKLKRLNQSNVVVIIDFDRTISSKDSQECHHLVGESKHMPEEFRKKFSVLLDNPNIVGTRWWNMAHDLIVQYKLTTEQINAMIKTSIDGNTVRLRPGMKELLDMLASLSVPVLIVSAGLKDLIIRFLDVWGVHHANTVVSSNEMSFNEEGVIASFRNPQVTSRNKRLTFSRHTNYFMKHKDEGRNRYIVIGDSPRDASIADQLPGESLKFGFYDGVKAWAKEEDYVAAYDVIIRSGDGNLIVEQLKGIFAFQKES